MSVYDSVLFLYNFQRECHDILCYSGTLYNAGSCAYESVCYEVYLKAITDTPPTVNVIKHGYIRQLEMAKLFKTNVLQLHIYYHADDFGHVDYFVLHLIVNEYWGYLRDQTEKGLLLRNNTMSVSRPTLVDNIYDEYVLQIMSYDVSFSEGMSSAYVPSANDVNSFDLLRSIQKHTYSTCTHKVVTFNKVRICPYLEVPLKSYPLSVKRGNLVIEDSSANSKPVHTFELLQWEYMIKRDQLRICISDMNRLLSALSKPVGNDASLVRYEFLSCMIVYLFSFLSKIRYLYELIRF